jgi:hypothetical protein
MSNAADRLKLGEAVLASSGLYWTCRSKNSKRTFWRILALSHRG